MATPRPRLFLGGVLALVALRCSPAPPPAPSAPLLPPVDVPIARPPAAVAPAPAVDDAPRAAAGPASPLETALGEWSRASQCQDYDYFPQGGIQSFWCHRPARVTLASIRDLAGVDIFARGPHGADLALQSAADFGHYDPAFVRWLVDSAGPSARGSAVQQATQASYDASLKPLATIFWQTYEKTQNDAACFAREKAAYGDLIARKKLPKDYYERWFYFMNPYFCDKGPARSFNFYSDNGFDAGVDGNVTKTVVGFWLRRSLDGTMDAFAAGLKKMLASYQPEAMAKATHFADPVALTRAIDGGVRAASTCSGAGKGSAVAVTIMVSPSGQVSARFPARRATATPAQLTCIEQKIASQQVTAFDGAPLAFSRTITLR
ncbi:hypothetical protein BH11MYX4_BH11MYX4_06540 [soil metagenome]